MDPKKTWVVKFLPKLNAFSRYKYYWSNKKISYISVSKSNVYRFFYFLISAYNFFANLTPSMGKIFRGTHMATELNSWSIIIARKWRGNTPLGQCDPLWVLIASHSTCVHQWDLPSMANQIPTLGSVCRS